MTQFLYSALGFIVALGILVAVHEFGHFWVARRLGVKVLRFSLGFGMPLWSRTSKKDGTEYAIGAIPLGGYVKMLEDDGTSSPEESKQAFNKQGLPVRAAVVLAGPMFNFLFAIIAYALVFSVGIEGIKPLVGAVTPDSIAEKAGIRPGDELVKIDGRENRTWNENRLYLFNSVLKRDPVTLTVRGQDQATKDVLLDFAGSPKQRFDSLRFESVVGLTGWMPMVPAVVGDVVPGHAAEQAGLAAGDEIVKADDTDIEDWNALVQYIQPRFDQSITLSVLRDGHPLDFKVVPARVDTERGEVGQIGVRVEAPTELPPSMLVKVDVSPWNALERGVENTWLMSSLTLKMLWRMLKLEVSPKNISGPLTIADYAGRTAQIGLDSFLTFLAVVSISLGVLNLLPIPILDGGHLVYYIAEAIKGSPLSDRVLNWTQQIGILMVAGLMCLAFYNDIVRLLG